MGPVEVGDAEEGGLGAGVVGVDGDLVGDVVVGGVGFDV